ncbi:hypothetical protein [Massilia sp. YIM B04103]|uniref:hypothetical protein n=1 Tax=Massilia sp. YIM B04103 TaxID=2963106 RepID=UPI00210AF9B1|nr:hypothetical protein [Massilia sp. YIM B04103]
MWKRFLILSTGLACGLFCIRLFLQHDVTEALPSAASEKKDVRSEGKLVQHAETRPAGGVPSLFTSPFGNASSQDVKIAGQVDARSKKMMERGYGTPAEYHIAPLAQLQLMAKQGDVYALLQLGEQLRNESGELVKQEGYDFSASAREQSYKYFAKAVEIGHIRAAAILAKNYAEDGNLVEAYAWNALAKTLGDNSNDAWASATFNGISQSEQKDALRKSSDYYALAIRRFNK